MINKIFLKSNELEQKSEERELKFVKEKKNYFRTKNSKLNEKICVNIINMLYVHIFLLNVYILAMHLL